VAGLDSEDMASLPKGGINFAHLKTRDNRDNPGRIKISGGFVSGFVINKLTDEPRLKIKY
jgi:hypothetical protein